MNDPSQRPFRNPNPHRLDAYVVSLELIEALRPIVAAIAKVDPALATQLRRAATSVPLNLSEGNRREGRDRRQLWRVAAGSADEVRACLDAAVAWRAIDAERGRDALALIDRVVAMLWRMTH
jgi:four helix bundle protein